MSNPGFDPFGFDVKMLMQLGMTYARGIPQIQALLERSEDMKRDALTVQRHLYEAAVEIGAVDPGSEPQGIFVTLSAIIAKFGDDVGIKRPDSFPEAPAGGGICSYRTGPAMDPGGEPHICGNDLPCDDHDPRLVDPEPDLSGTGSCK